LQGHFHIKGKAPSKFTLDVLKQAKATLPFADERDFEEQKKGTDGSYERPQDHG
jgi:alkyl sulfatase BDS1-like metallo-beta-lactamase superfamily hydrolase